MGSIVFNKFLFSFEGRINRAKYCYAIYATSISCLVFLSIFGAALKLVHVGYLYVFKNPLSLPFDASFRNALLFYAGWNFASLAAITIKRLQDRNRSGWWIVPFFIAPPLLHRLSDWLDNLTLALLVDALGFSLGVWCFIELLCLSGTRGPNRFGSDPLAPRETRPRWDQHSEIEFVPHSAGPPPAWLVKRGHE
jgi:uncharacterized membrane protein YhaH (DUF805 family)